jgi:hypothetical protein
MCRVRCTHKGFAGRGPLVAGPRPHAYLRHPASPSNPHRTALPPSSCPTAYTTAQDMTQPLSSYFVSSVSGMAENLAEHGVGGPWVVYGCSAGLLLGCSGPASALVCVRDAWCTNEDAHKTTEAR